MKVNQHISRRQKIKTRSRQTLFGTKERPRLCVFRSNTGIYAQLINDDAAQTIAGSSFMDKALKGTKVSKTEMSKLVGKTIAEKAVAMGVKSVVFDRNGFLYHGRIKALADAAREAGLQF